MKMLVSQSEFQLIYESNSGVGFNRRPSHPISKGLHVQDGNKANARKRDIMDQDPHEHSWGRHWGTSTMTTK